MAVICSNCLKVKPLCACPAAPQVHEFALCDGERFVFDLWAQEHTGIAGTKIEFWSLDLKTSKRDPLYDEAIERRFLGPFPLKGVLTWPEGFPEAREEGFKQTFNGTVWIARKEFEDHNAPSPTEGDVLRVWDIPFFQAAGVDGENVPGRGYYFDITNVDDDGHLFDTASFVGFKCDIQRRTEFTPERRLTNT